MSLRFERVSVDRPERTFMAMSAADVKLFFECCAGALVGRTVPQRG
jgi:hypothetical protein